MSDKQSETKTVLPGHETQTEEMNCPSCGRFVGAKNKCPYCGARVTKRMSLVAIRWAAVLLATVGMACLWAMAKYKTMPLVKIGDLQATMNFAQVRLDGTAQTDARTFRNGGMGFNIADGTGSLQVFISQKQAAELQRTGRVPRAGDKVRMCGSVSLSDKDASIRLQSVDSFELDRAPARSMKLGDVDEDLKGDTVVVEGLVTDFGAPPAGSKKPYTLKLRDETGERTVTFWQTEYDQIREKDTLMGSRVRMRIAVSTYKGKLQLKLTDGLSVEPVTAEEAGAVDAPAKAEAAAPAAKAPARDFSRGKAARESVYQDIGGITKEMKGKTVRVKGRVASVKDPEEGSNRPTEVTLRSEDGKKALTVKYWAKTAEVIKDLPKPGYLFDITGEVDVFKGRVSLKVGSGYNIKLVSDAPPSGPAVDVSLAEAVDALGPDRKGETVVLVGTLGEDHALQGGAKYPLTDGKGDTVEVVFWEGRVPADLLNRLDEGMKVAVRGTVGIYNGSVNVTADAGYSVIPLE